MYHSSFNHSPDEGYQDSVQFGAITNNITINMSIYIYIPLSELGFHFWGDKFPEV